MAFLTAIPLSMCRLRQRMEITANTNILDTTVHVHTVVSTYDILFIGRSEPLIQWIFLQRRYAFVINKYDRLY